MIRKIHTCTQCSYKTTSITSIEQHVKNHKTSDDLQEAFSCTDTTIEPYICDVCRYKSSFVVELKKHTRTTHRIKEETKESKPKELSETFHCQNCGFRTFSQLVLLRHVHVNCTIRADVKIHVVTDEAPPEVEPKSASSPDKCYTCDRCSYRTESNLFFTMHVTAEHTNRSPPRQEEPPPLVAVRPRRTPEEYESMKYECKRCPYRSKWRSGLRVHMIKHLSKNVRWYGCKQCPYKTKWKQNLQAHKISKHTALEDIKWFQCKYCPYKAKVGSCLRNHFLAKHIAFRDVKWLYCDKCPHKTKWKSNLKVHIQAKHPRVVEAKESEEARDLV